MLASEFPLYAGQMQPTGRANVEACLDSWGIERHAFEATINRLTQDAGPIYYVSTVPRGQAGTTSDLDVIVVGQALETPTLSNMLFHEARRIGAKVISAHAVSEAITVLSGAASVSQGDRSVAVQRAVARLPVKWADLERVINGVSFGEENPFLSGLPALAECQRVVSLTEYVRQRANFHLAIDAGGGAGANAYLSLAMISAMDAIMAACGRVQSNNKWTFVRWARFVADVSSRPLSGQLAPVEAALEHLHTTISPNADALADVDGVLRQFFGERCLPAMRAGPVAGVHISRFLPGAISVSNADRTMVLAGAVADLTSALEGANEQASSIASVDLLRLLQHGFVEQVRS